MSLAGIASRRHAEDMVRAGQVTVNGKTAVIGQVIDEKRDVVKVDGKVVTGADKKVYYLLNKPRSYVSTVFDPEGRKTVLSLIPSDVQVYPVGRLDYESEGLMLLTNDGDLAYRLTHPKFEVEKTYRVQVKGVTSAVKIKKLESGIVIDGKRTSPAKIELAEKTADRSWFDITIHEGRNRQIRKMCDAVGLPVMRLIRTRLGPYTLDDLKPGEYRAVTP